MVIASFLLDEPTVFTPFVLPPWLASSRIQGDHLTQLLYCAVNSTIVFFHVITDSQCIVDYICQKVILIKLNDVLATTSLLDNEIHSGIYLKETTANYS